MIDGLRQLGLVARRVEPREVDGEPANVVMLEQTYPTSIDDLWDVLTNPERIPRWFLPISGDLQVGGRYQIEGNAGGTITACDAPHRFDATWEFGGAVSWIEVRLREESAEATCLTLAHIARPDAHWQQFGPGAVGIGWDGALLGLALHIETGVNAPAEAADWMTSPDGIAFYRTSGEKWIEADIASGTSPETAQTRGQTTMGFYSGSSAE